MRKLILIPLVFLFIGCSDPYSVVIPEYQIDREQSEEYQKAVRKLSDEERKMLNGFVGMCQLSHDPVNGATIGQAIELMEKWVLTR
jgi:hypothetical protein